MKRFIALKFKAEKLKGEQRLTDQMVKVLDFLCVRNNVKAPNIRLNFCEDDFIRGKCTLILEWII